VTFIGYPRSGHSLVGSLLDAHPDIVIAHELDALERIERSCEKLALWSAILENSRALAATGRQWEEYSYGVPGQWNGRFRDLRVLGDKKGGRSTLRLGERPELLEALRRTVQVRCQFIHVIRNPYDNISTISRRRGTELAEAIDDYFGRCEIVGRIRAQLSPPDWYDLQHEELVANPAEELTKLCRFLEQRCDPQYLLDCSRIVFAFAHRSRHEAPWTPELISRVLERLARFNFLQGYTFDA
jgi:hypothetical protein